MSELGEAKGDADDGFCSERPGSDSVDKGSKRGQIKQACEQQNVQLLVQLADTPGGLLDDGLRQLACETPSFNPRS